MEDDEKTSTIDATMLNHKILIEKSTEKIALRAYTQSIRTHAHALIFNNEMKSRPKLHAG